MRRCIVILLCAVLVGALLTGCAETFYYFTDAVRFRRENESGQEIYMAALSFGTEDTVFGSMSGENADGTALADRGKECLVFPVETGDLNDAKLEDMRFDVFVGTQKGSDFTYIGRVILESSQLHRTYTITVTEVNGRLTLTSAEPELKVIPAEET